MKLRLIIVYIFCLIIHKCTRAHLLKHTLSFIHIHTHHASKNYNSLLIKHDKYKQRAQNIKL